MNDVVFMLEKKSTQKLDMGTSRFTVVSMGLFGLSLRFIGLYEESIHGVQKWVFLKFFYLSLINILASDLPPISSSPILSLFFFH